ncbi:MAG: DegV family protein [Anaerolineales bacterium]|nr:MAG: DegV family protein [Anaerolineales bacterium]
MNDKKILVVTDSSASLPAELQAELDIRVIPLWLIWDDQCFRDGVDIDPHTFYQRLKDSKTLPSSTQPSAVEFKDYFQKLAGECDGIVSVLASSRISGTVDSAESAREMITVPVRVVDSLFSAMGQGLIAAAAARAAAAGNSIDEVTRVAEMTRDATNLLFVVDTLEYLHKGGRIGGAKRLMGTALNIKPILHFYEGTIQPLSQTRTKKKGIQEMLNITAERLGSSLMAEAAVVHVDCLEEGQSLVEEVKNRFNPPLIHLSDVSPVVGTHVGPGALGLAFYPEAKK